MVGATSALVLRGVLLRGARIALAGAFLGLPLAWAGSGLLRAALYGVEPGDPLTYVGVVLLLGAVGIAASWLPARRAAATDPIEVLRSD